MLQRLMSHEPDQFTVTHLRHPSGLLRGVVISRRDEAQCRVVFEGHDLERLLRAARRAEDGDPQDIRLPSDAAMVVAMLADLAA